MKSTDDSCGDLMHYQLHPLSMMLLLILVVVAMRKAFPVHGAYCGVGSVAALKQLHLRDQSWPGHRVTTSPLKSSVTDSVVLSNASGTSGSFFATASDSNYCAGALIDTVD